MDNYSPPPFPSSDSPPPPSSHRNLVKIVLFVFFTVLCASLITLMFRTSLHSLTTTIPAPKTSPSPAPAPVIESTSPDAVLELLLSQIKAGNRQAVTSLISPKSQIKETVFTNLYAKDFTSETTFRFLETPGTIAHYTVVFRVNQNSYIHRLIFLKETDQWLLVEDEKGQLGVDKN